VLLSGIFAADLAVQPYETKQEKTIIAVTASERVKDNA
jgi:hypothetical protein